MRKKIQKNNEYFELPSKNWNFCELILRYLVRLTNSELIAPFSRSIEQFFCDNVTKCNKIKKVFQDFNQYFASYLQLSYQNNVKHIVLKQISWHNE